MVTSPPSKTSRRRIPSTKPSPSIPTPTRPSLTRISKEQKLDILHNLNSGSAAATLRGSKGSGSKAKGGGGGGSSARLKTSGPQKNSNDVSLKSTKQKSTKAGGEEEKEEEQEGDFYSPGDIGRILKELEVVHGEDVSFQSTLREYTSVLQVLAHQGSQMTDLRRSMGDLKTKIGLYSGSNSNNNNHKEG
eukprot:Nk52_evm82s208 gene=Nk52_evmTU82s208